jgi:Na+/melibiose symporter-like transporter
MNDGPTASLNRPKRPWLTWAILFVAVLVVALYFSPDHNLEPSSTSTFTSRP